MSKASSFLLACLTGLTGFGWIDLAGLTGFSSRTFLRSLPCRGHTCEVALLLEVVGGVGSVNTRLASGINHSNDYGKFPMFWYLLAFNRKKRKENEKTREKREFRHKARWPRDWRVQIVHPNSLMLSFFICYPSPPSRFYDKDLKMILSGSQKNFITGFAGLLQEFHGP